MNKNELVSLSILVFVVVAALAEWLSGRTAMAPVPVVTGKWPA